ncbi:MAG: Mrp/NBP35 family ATP-binding protein [Anaeroplasmataceae bacterium]|nr:Mrp/NBP35 family ATP-binding protein [Anaeroplasmataceae bacterium]
MSCNHNCSSCSSKDCGDRTAQSLIVETAKENNIKKIIGVVSGKGGVGKSTVTSLLAVELAKKGYHVGVMDADITGPSIPTAFGVHQQVVGNGTLMFPPISNKLGIKLISVNLLIDEPTKPVLWRGPVIGGAVKQFYSDVLWEDLDYLLIDMPPGTGDVALTVFQSLPVDEVIIVSTPQDLVSMIVGKAVNMCKMMNIPVLGLVENMSYMPCPCCKEHLYPFGKSKLNDVAKEYGLTALDALPINPDVAAKIDLGQVEDVDSSVLTKTIKALENLR